MPRDGDLQEGYEQQQAMAAIELAAGYKPTQDPN